MEEYGGFTSPGHAKDVIIGKIIRRGVKSRHINQQGGTSIGTMRRRRKIKTSNSILRRPLPTTSRWYQHPMTMMTIHTEVDGSNMNG